MAMSGTILAPLLLSGNMRSLLTYALLIAVGAVFLSSCLETEVNYAPLLPGPGYSLEVAQDVTIYYSDSSMMRVSIAGPVLNQYVYKFRVEQEFPSGVHVEFFDPEEKPTAWMDARYAMRRPNDKIIIARDSVVLYNNVGSRIESSELIWDERTQTLSTDRFVQIIRPPADTIYSYGFKTNQDFTEYELYSVEGDMTFRDFNSKYEE